MRRHATDIFRTLFPPLLALLGVLLFFSLYRYGSAPTDENWFRDAPSQLMVEGAGPAGSGLESLLPGDLIAGVGGKPVHTPEDFRAALAAGNEPVPVKVFRPANDRGFEVHAGPAALARLPVRIIPTAAHVFEVIEDGASDRAGMKPGDLIVRINGKSFRTSNEADAIMRRGKTGGTTEYVVLRGTEEKTLLVKLAAFGLQFPVIVLFLCGLLWIATGAFLGLARPGYQGARLEALSLVCLGFVMGVMFIQREGGQDAFAAVRGVTLVVCTMFGMAFVAHALWHYPFERERLPRDRWYIGGVYALAAAASAAVLMIREGNALFFGAYGLFGLCIGIIAVMLKRRGVSPERREVMRVLRWTGTIAGVLSAAAALIIVFGVRAQGAVLLNIGFIGLPLALVPLAHLYTIGRYRLLDLRLRVRRNIQYTLITALWMLGMAVLLLWGLNRLARTEVTLPYFRVTAGSLEYVGKEMPPEIRGLAQKTFMLAAGIPLAALWWVALRRGRAWIAARFHRSGYDYRRAANELAEAMATNFSMEDLAGGIVTRLTALMQLKRAGVLFFRDERSCCCLEAKGFDAGTWKDFCLRNDAALAREVGRRTAEFPVRALDPPLRDELRAHEFEYVVPVHSQHKLVGALLIGEKQSETVFTGEDLEFLGAVARQASVAIENAFLYEELAEQERLKHELAIARRIQMESLPQATPQIAGLDIAGRSIPAQEVGGDYFDYLDGDGRHLTVVIGDVSGKGTSAALYMAKIQGILRSLHAFDLAPAELFARTNDLLCRDLEKKSFVTALTASFDPPEHRLVVARAGHLPLFVYRRRTAAVERVLPRGLGLGISAEGFFRSELESRGLAFETGDVFLFVTDGVTEARDAQGMEFGEERLVGLLHDVAQRDAAGILQSVLDAVDTHAAGRERHDDQTVVVVKASRNSSPS